MEQRLEAILASQSHRGVRGFLPTSGGDQQNRASGPDVRQHGGAGTCFGRRRKRGQQNQALGRSRGGFSCKIHLKTDFDGLPIAFHLTGGEVSDSTQLKTSLDIGPDIEPPAASAALFRSSRIARTPKIDRNSFRSCFTKLVRGLSRPWVS